MTKQEGVWYTSTTVGPPIMGEKCLKGGMFYQLVGIKSLVAMWCTEEDFEAKAGNPMTDKEVEEYWNKITERWKNEHS